MKPKLYKGEYEFYIIDEYGYVIDTFYNVKEFKEAYPELANKDKNKLNSIVSRLFTKKMKYFLLNDKKYTIEFQKYEECENENKKELLKCLK